MKKIKYYQIISVLYLILGVGLCFISTPIHAKKIKNKISSKDNDRIANNLSSQQKEITKPFFWMGDGKIKMMNTHNGKSVDVNYLKADGKMDDTAFAQIDSIFGFPTTEKGENISRRTIAMLDYFSDLTAPGKIIRLVSGFRSPSYNQSLRDKGRIAAKTSTHIDGMALDFSIAGVKGIDLWNLIRGKDCCGVGNYGSDIVHLDSGRPRFWQAATSKVDTDASAYNRYIYVSSEYDRYKPGDKVRLFFTSVSDFGFGVDAKIKIVTDKEGDSEAANTELENSGGKCTIVADRKASRFLYVTIPDNLPAGKYRFRVDFCKTIAEAMPKLVVSNEWEMGQ